VEKYVDKKSREISKNILKYESHNLGLIHITILNKDKGIEFLTSKNIYNYTTLEYTRDQHTILQYY